MGFHHMVSERLENDEKLKRKGNTQEKKRLEGEEGPATCTLYKHFPRIMNGAHCELIIPHSEKERQRHSRTKYLVL